MSGWQQGANRFYRRWVNFRSSVHWFTKWRRQRSHFKFFETSFPGLTVSQRSAVLADEPLTQVIASAGSGKTSVAVAKVACILHDGDANPDEVLVMAFNQKAAEELRERCRALGQEVDCSTFHSLGRRIVAEGFGRVGKVSELATDGTRLKQFVGRALEELAADPKHWPDIRKFFLFNYKPVIAELEIETREQYAHYIRTHELRALDGTLVKSRGELDIANYLYANRIPFEYEPAIMIVRDGRKVPYVPDFYLPLTRTYIEYFGVDREGRTAPFIDFKRYAQEMQWKTSYHETHGNDLISLFAWQRSEGVLPDTLAGELQRRSVAHEPRDESELFSVFREKGLVGPFVDLVGTMLTHVRETGLSSDRLELDTEALHPTERPRAAVFITAFQPILKRYEEHLRSRGEIDFPEMIARAVRAIADGRYRPLWKYIIVDEFQDISSGRYQLLRKLVELGPNSKAFVVGDDWQAIYRFAGGDIGLIVEAKRLFRIPWREFLDQTFRFGPTLADVTNQFIRRNPNQIPKTVRSRKENLGVAKLWWTRRPIRDGLIAAVKDQATRSSAASSLQILARYNSQLPDRSLLDVVRKVWPGEVLEPATVHRSKGREADFVVVLGVKGGRLGFPSEIADDPLLGMVLADESVLADAEERRLMYVALTRSKERVDLLCDPIVSSSFAYELMETPQVFPVGRPLVEQTCPRCKDGVIGTPGDKYRACSAHPVCKYAVPKCPSCSVGLLMRIDTHEARAFQCIDALCLASFTPCETCDEGYWMESKDAARKPINCSDRCIQRSKAAPLFDAPRANRNHS
jgi:DNA helicase IV